MNKRKGSINIVTLAFRHWSRKSFAVFNSLHKTIKICTLCVTYSIITHSASAWSQGVADSLLTKSYELEEVVVTAGRTPIELQQTAHIISVLTKSEIDRFPSQSLNDILLFLPGVDIRQRGPFGTQADISIRGGTYEQTLILLNGVNVSDPQTGHFNLNLPVDIESIRKIEILEGPAAKSFGPNAFNGVINIITGNSYQNHIRVSGMYGQDALNKASFNISNTIGRLEHFLSVFHMSSDGYIRNTDFSNDNIFYQAKYSTIVGAFDFQAGYNAKEFGANSFYSLKYPDQFEATATKFLSLRFQGNGKVKFTPIIYLRQNRDLFELKRNDESFPYNHHRTMSSGINVNIWTENRWGKTSIGIDIRNEHILSNVLGNILNIPIAVQGFKNTFYTKSYNRINTSVFAEYSFTLKRFSVNEGIMVYHNSDLCDFGIYPGIDVSYRIRDNLRVYSTVNKTLRMPSFTDMFYSSPVQLGNPLLKPEKAKTIEGGIKYSNSNLKSNLAVFRRFGKDLIDWVRYPSTDSMIWRSKNHARVNFTGVEFSIAITPDENSFFKRIKSLGISYLYLQADSIQSNLLSKYSLDYLQNQITANIDFRIIWKLYSSSRLTFRDRSGQYQNVSGAIEKYRPFWLSDTKISWKGEKFSFYAEASNIFNTSYCDFGGIIQPGIAFRGGIVFDLNYK